jgi:signal transduction histidine kinase
VDLTAYRVVQEALTNVIKHSGAGRARVLLSYRARLPTLDRSASERTTA